MTPRLRLAVRLNLCSRPPIVARPRLYSSAPEPVIRITDVEAPNSGFIRVLELNRPAARNSISRALLGTLREQIDDVQGQYGADGEELQANVLGKGMGKKPTRALVLASAVDECFCAGADLKERRAFTAEETEAFLTNLRATLAALSALPIPTITAISSVALGGGLELALATHFRVLASTASVGLPETRLGIIPGAGGTYRLPALVGLGRARDLILTGRRVSAPEAYFLGIADRLVEVVPGEYGENGAGGEADGKELLARARGEALNEAVRLAMEICEGGPVAIRAGLEAVNWAREEVENKMYERVVGTEDRNEALRAFSEKRKPVFKGR